MNNLFEIFKNVVMMSGTPDHGQVDLTLAYPENECKCSPRMAMDNGWICRPELSLVECGRDEWPSAVKKVFEYEMSLWNAEKIFRPTLLVNCLSIDDIEMLRNVPWFKDNAGKTFHLISIHSDKRIKGKNEVSARDVTAEIDGVKKTAEEAYQAIEQIDSGTLFGDDLPIIVFQVQMIGEGINVKSFNAVLTASPSDRTAMQQIGRALRNFTVKKTVESTVYNTVTEEVPKKGIIARLLHRTETVTKQIPCTVTNEIEYTKVKSGHANVYVIQDNFDDIVDFICSLDQYDLTDQCFTWGRRIDVKTGSKVVSDEQDFSEEIGNDWKDIDESDPDIRRIINSARRFVLERANMNWLAGEDNDGNGIPDSIELAQLVNSKAKESFKEVYIGHGKKTDAEIFNSLMNIIAGQLSDKWKLRIWRRSMRTFLLCTFGGDSEIADFFMTHISKKQKDTLSKLCAE